MNFNPGSGNPYFLPEDYRENVANVTMDSGDAYYWDPLRVKRATLHQFAVYQWAFKIVREGDIQVIADVGCGFATKLKWLYRRFPDIEFWGVDQPSAIELCKQNYKFGKWLGVNLEENPAIPPQKANLVISSDVIEHLSSPDILLDYFRRIVAPSGLILMSTPERNMLRGKECRHSPNPYHIREWNKHELANFLESRGFKIIEHRILPALRPDLSLFYIRKALSRWGRGKSMRYNQAVLMQVK